MTAECSGECARRRMRGRRASASATSAAQVPLRPPWVLRRQGDLPLLQQLEEQWRRVQMPLTHVVSFN
jgi:hypothetical protein